MPFGAQPSALTPPLDAFIAICVRRNPRWPYHSHTYEQCAYPFGGGDSPSMQALSHARCPASEGQADDAGQVPGYVEDNGPGGTKVRMSSRFAPLLTVDRTLSTWFYQYWYFAFVTAQEWGRGPLHWTAELLDFANYGTVRSPSLTNTPHNNGSSGTPGVRHAVPRPPSTCHWSIHVGWQNAIETRCPRTVLLATAGRKEV